MEPFVRFLRRRFQPLWRLVYKYYLHLEVHHISELQQDQVYLFCSNHSSHLDSLAIVFGSGFSEKYFAATAAHDYFFESPLKMNLFKLFIDIIPLKRNPSYKQVKENLRCIHQQIERGKNIIFFPEGTRSCDGSVRCFKKGLGFIAKELQISIVPVYIQGAHLCWPKGKWLIRPGRLKIFFGNPIDLHLKLDLTSEQITHTVQSEVTRLSLQEHSPKRVADYPAHHAPVLPSGFTSSSLESELDRTESEIVNL